MSRRAPTIICLEDLHWADPSSLELIRFLLSDFRYPALVILVYRPTLSLLSHQQTENLGEAYVEIRLEDLSPAETEAMVGSLLKSDALPPELKRFVRDKAGGNPFYLEEIINSLVESGTLSPEKDGWVLRKTISEARISATVHGVIAARVDRLEPAVKCILQEAAVIGRSFSHDILCRITDCETDLWHHLGSLETLDIIKARSFRPSVEYIFKHALTQEVVYGGLVKARRKAIHERVARVLEELYADRLPESYEALAYHFQRGASPDKAVTYLAASGAKSLGRYALEEAHRYYQSAYDRIGQHFTPPQSDRMKIELINQWAFVHYYRGRYEELLKLLSDHRQTADRLSDDKTRGMFHAWLGCALWHRERFREAHQTLLTALSLAKDKEDMAFVGYASCWLAWVCSELGLLDEALAHAAKAQEIYRAGESDDFIYFSSVAATGYALWHKGEMAETAATGQMLLQFGREHGDYRAKGMGYCCLGWSALMGGDIPDACRFFEKAVLVSVDPWYAIFPKLALAYGLMVNGRVHEAKRQIAEGEAFCKEFGAEFGGQPARFFKGVILVGEGRVDEGLSLLEECCRNWRQNGSKLRFAAFGAMVASVYAELYRKARAGGQAELSLCAQKQATAYFENAVESAAEIGAKGTLARAYRAWGRFYQEQGDSDQARGCFTTAAAYFRSCGVETLAREAEDDQRALEEDPGAVPTG
jgi:tetratricopeptide (TPR) repeat protein